MPRCPGLYPTPHIVKPIFSASRFNEAGRVVGTIVPKKQANENNNEGGMMKKTEETADPMVAFSRPPPVPPLIGPLLALSLLETWSSRDEDDN